MNPVQDLFDAMSPGIPRVSGDEPPGFQLLPRLHAYSPRERG